MSESSTRPGAPPRATTPRTSADAADDYVKTIYSHTEWQPEPITPSQLAARLGLAPSSVTEMVKKLAAAGLIDHRPYGAIRLTAAGEQRALEMLRRHRLIETWLVRIFGYGWDEVDDEAEVLEHAVSDRLLEQIDVQLGRPARDPHGDVIPAADGSLSRPDAVRLDHAPQGLSGKVVRISDRDPDTLRVLDALGIELDEPVSIAAQQDAAAGVTIIRRSGSAVVISPSVAGAVWMEAATGG